ncbi:MAG: septal ring lytic transglycosylase RlpA family protein [Thermodesulfobacteriota bacterium]
MKIKILLILAVIPILFACGKKDVGSYPAPAPKPKPHSPGYTIEGSTQIGLASWYGLEEHNNYAASGERFSKYDYTAAHKTLPLGTVVRVTNLENGRDVVVKVNDRGPFVGDRIIDLSHAPAQSIDMIQKGVVKVKVEVVSSPSTRDTNYFNPEYTVQVASYTSRSSADNAKRQLEYDFNNVRIESAKINGNTYYRVRVGRYTSKKDARKAASKLKKKGYTTRVILE